MPERMNEAERTQRLAELAVRVGANVQQGQLVVVSGLVEHAPLVREIARAAYRAGARVVKSDYGDRHFTRALVELGPDGALSYSAPWEVSLLQTLDAENGAYIRTAGDPEPNLLSDLDGARLGKAQPRAALEEWRRIVSSRS